MTLSMADIDQWQPDKIDEVAEALAERARTGGETAQDLRGLQDMAKWEGKAGDAAKHAIEKSATNLETSAQNDFLTSMATKKSAKDVRSVKNDLKAIVDYAAGQPAVPINLETNTVTKPDTTGWDDDDIQKLNDKIAELEDRIVAMLAAATETDSDLGRVMAAAAGGDQADYKQGPAGLDDAPPEPGENVFPYPWKPAPPKGSVPGGGEWVIDYSHPYQGSGPPVGPPPVEPWRKQYEQPIVGPTSGMKDIVSVPTNGWGTKPHVTGQEEYRFRLMGRGFDGAPEHVQWVHQDGKYYPTTWVGYDYEVEHVRQVAGQEGAVNGVTMRWGMGEWQPIEISDVYQAQARNPALTMYLPNPNGMFELSPKDSVARGR